MIGVSKTLSIVILALLISTSTQTPTTSTQPQPYIHYIFTPQCYTSLITELNLTDLKCLKLTLSKGLGYALVAGGAIVKVPQVIKILVEKSVYGISFTSVMAQSMTNWVTIVYSWYRGNPFSIYGENVFILGQNLVILGLFVMFGRNVPKGVPAPSSNVITKYSILLLTFLLTMFLTQNPLSWPKPLIDYCMVLQICLFSFARLTQIIHVFKCKSTGSLALATCLLVFLGNLGRLFTVFVEISGDYMFAISICLASLLNGTILGQFFVYWGNGAKEKKEKKDK